MNNDINNNRISAVLEENTIGSISNPVTTGEELRDAIINAPSGGIIYLLDITLTEQLLFDSLPDITVTLASATDETVTITSFVLYPFFGINFNGTTANLTFQNVIYDGNNTGLGFRLSNPNSYFTMNNAFIQNCVNPNNGGAIQVDAGSIILNECVFNNNVVLSGNGGGVFVRFGTAVADACIFIENTASFNGGAIYVSGSSSGDIVAGAGEITLRSCYVYANVAGDGGFGGGIFADGNILISGTHIIRNIGSCGGGIAGGDVVIQDRSILQENVARISPETLELFREFEVPCGGGGIYTNNNNLVVNDSLLYNNKSLNDMDGGGIFFGCLLSGNAFITDSLILGNSAPEGDGGAIFTDQLSSVRVDADSVFGENTAQSYVYWEITTSDDSNIHRMHILTNSFSSFIPNQSVPEFAWNFLNAYNNYDINYVQPLKTVTVNYVDASRESFIIHSTIINSFLGATVVIPLRETFIDSNGNEWILEEHPTQQTQIIELIDPAIDYIVTFFYVKSSPCEECPPCHCICCCKPCCHKSCHCKPCCRKSCCHKPRHCRSCCRRPCHCKCKKSLCNIACFSL